VQICSLAASARSHARLASRRRDLQALPARLQAARSMSLGSRASKRRVRCVQRCEGQIAGVYTSLTNHMSPNCFYRRVLADWCQQRCCDKRMCKSAAWQPVLAFMPGWLPGGRTCKRHLPGCRRRGRCLWVHVRQRGGYVVCNVLR
jgi:hypothetical protein